MKKSILLLFLFYFSFHAQSCKENSTNSSSGKPTSSEGVLGKISDYNTCAKPKNFFDSLAIEAEKLTLQKIEYDPSYFVMKYPNGEIPKGKGVCTDVVIRAYRKMGIDLQKEVHEDMKHHFSQYPKIWGARSTDTNIDHRRVPNLMKFFHRKNAELPISKDPKDYRPGDVVAWNLGGAITHIGIVSNTKNKANNQYLIVHNIGAGQVMENCLFNYTIIGHYRYAKQ